MKSRRPLTTTLPVEFLERLDELARETGKKKNVIIEHAVTDWIRHRTQLALAESYRHASPPAPL